MASISEMGWRDIERLVDVRSCRLVLETNGGLPLQILNALIVVFIVPGGAFDSIYLDIWLCRDRTTAICSHWK